MRVLDTFDPAFTTLDVHTSNGLVGSLPPRDGDAILIRQVVSGVARHARVMRVFLNALFHTNAARAHRGDFRAYEVLTYCALFRLDEMGMGGFSSFLSALPAHRAAILVRFLLDAQALADYVITGWCSFLDRTYVEMELLERIERFRAPLTAWLAKADMASAPGGDAALAAAKAATAHSKRALTVPRAPALTRPRPRVPPEPLRIPTGFTARPIPSSLDANSLADIEAAHAAASRAVREATAARYGPDGPVGPALVATRSNMDRLRAQVAAAREAESAPIPELRARPAPVLNAKGADVRLTHASILREDAMFKAQQAAECALLKNYEATLHDASGYDAWRASELAKDAAAREAATGERRAEVFSAAAAAAAAAASVRRHKDGIAARLRKAGGAAEAHVKAEKEGGIALKAELVAQVRKYTSEVPAAALARAEAERVTAAGVRRGEAAATSAALSVVRAHDAAEKKEAILKLRAAEKVPKSFDPTLAFDRTVVGGSADPDAGIYLEAMSLAELRERLTLVRLKDAEQTAARHFSILSSKHEEGEILRAMADGVATRRVRAAAAAAERRGDKRAAALAAETADDRRKEERLLAMAATLAASDERSTASRSNEATAAARGATLCAKLSDSVNPVRADRARAQSRTAAAAQQAVLNKATAVEAVKTADANAAATYKDALRAAATAAAKKARLELDATTVEGEVFRAAEAARRKDIFFAETGRSRALQEALAATHPYAAAQSQTLRDTVRFAKGADPVADMHFLTATKRLERRDT